MLNKLYMYAGIAGAVLLAGLKIWFMGYSKARDEVKAKSQAIKIKAHENLNKAQKQSAEALENVKNKTDNNDFSSFNDS